MLKELILKEIREQILTPKMAFYAFIIMLVMIVNGYVFNINYDKKMTKYNEIRNENLANVHERSPSLRNMFFFRQKLIKPPSKLAFLSEAEEAVLPNGIWINYFEESQPEYYKGQNIFFSRFNSVDWTFILIYLIGFVCIAFSYDAFSGEKVGGTLKLIFSNSMPKGTLIIGKLAGILICICIPLVIGCITDFIIVQLNPNIVFTTADYSCILLFLVAALLFISLNILLGFIASCLTSRPIHSLNLALVLWIFMNIIVPSISWVSAKKLVDVPSQSRIAEYASSEVNKIWESDKYYSGWNGSWEGEPPNEFVYSRAEGCKVRTNLSLEIWRSYLHNLISQTNLAIRLSKLSPVSVFRFIGERISDNGFFGFLRFHDQALVFKTVFDNFAFEKDQQDHDSYHLIWNEEWASRTFSSGKPVAFEEIPQFDYRQPLLSETLNESVWDFFILVLWNLVLFIGAFVSFLRYDVR